MQSFQSFSEMGDNNNDEQEGNSTEYFEPRLVLSHPPKSVIWKFFKFVGKVNAPDKTKTVCSLCLESTDVKKKGKIIPYNNGTSNMKAHLERNHKAELHEAEEKLNAKSDAASSQPLITDFFSRQNCEIGDLY